MTLKASGRWMMFPDLCADALQETRVRTRGEARASHEARAQCSVVRESRGVFPAAFLVIHRAECTLGVEACDPELDDGVTAELLVFHDSLLARERHGHDGWNLADQRAAQEFIRHMYMECFCGVAQRHRRTAGFDLRGRTRD